MSKQKTSFWLLLWNTLRHGLKRVFFDVWNSLHFTPVFSIRARTHTRVYARKALVAVVARRRLVSSAVLGLTMVVSLGLNLIHPVQTQAAVSDNLNFQARLEGADGSITNDGNYNVEFKIYKSLSSGGSVQGTCVGGVTDDCLWMEDYTSGNKLRVVNGYLTVNLGSITAFPGNMPWDQDLYITMNVGGTGSPSWDGEMNPRLKLTAVPYAFQAKQAEQLQAVNSGFTGTLSFDTLSGDQNILLPDASGTVCLDQTVNNCGYATASGSNSYIQNGVSLQTNASFFIQATSGHSTTDPTAAIQAITGQTKDLLQFKNSSGNATGGFNSSGQLYFQSGSNAATLVQNTLTGAHNPTFQLPDVGGTQVICTVSTCTGGAGGSLGGSGTQYFIAEFGSGGNTVGDSSIYDDGTFVGIGTTTTTSGRLSVVSDLDPAQSGIYIQGADNATSPVAEIRLGTTPGAGSSLIDFRDDSGTLLATFDDNGSLLSAGSGTFGSSSALSGTTGRLNVKAAGGANVGQVLRAGSSQTGDLLQVQDSSGGRLSGFDALGQLFFDTGTYTGTIQQDSLSSTDITYELPDTGNASETICLVSTCTGGAGGSLTSSGTANHLALFTSSSNLGNSLLYEDHTAQDFIGLGTTSNNGLLSIQGVDTGQSSLFVQGTDSATVPVTVIRGGATPGSGNNLLELQHNDTTVVASFDKDGNFLTTGTITAGSLTNGGSGGIVTSNGSGLLSSSTLSRNSGFFTGTLTVANGGTGATSFNSNGLTYYNGTQLTSTAGTQTQGQILFAGSGGTPVFTTPTGDISSSPSTTGLLTISKLQGSTLTISSPSSGQYLRYNGSAFVNSALQASDLSGTLFSVHGSTGTDQTIASGDTLNVVPLSGGSGNLTTTTSSGTRTLSIDIIQSPTFTGTITASNSSGPALAVSGTPTATATMAQLLFGSSTGYAGNNAANGGTYIGINQPTSGAGSAADLLNFQSSGTIKLKVDSSGNTTLGGQLTVNGTGQTAIAIADSGAQNSGLTIGGDTNLYRSAVNELTTDGALVIGTNLTVNGLTTLNGDQFTNLGSTLDTSYSLGDQTTGDIDSANGSDAVDKHTSILIDQDTTTGAVLTLPDPTDTTPGRIVYVSNIGPNTFSINGVVLDQGSTQNFVWNGTAWSTLTGTGVTAIGGLDIPGFDTSANGATISGNGLYLQSATASVPGLVNTGTQTFAGAKTFSSLATFNGGVTLASGQHIIVNGDDFTDLTGSGLSVVSNALTVDATSSTGFFRNGGNSFGGQAVLGTNDNNSLAFRTNSGNRLVLATNGDLTFQQAGSTIGVSTSNGGLNLQANGTGTLALNTTGAGTVNLGTANTTTIGIGNSGSINTILGATTINGSGTASTTIGSSSSNTPITLQDNSASSLVLNTGGTSITGTLGVSGLTTLSGGLTATGTTQINTTGTANTTIGNSTGTFSLTSPGLNVSTAGALTGVTGITYASGAYDFDQSSSTGTFKTGSGAVSLNGNTTVTGSNTLTVGGLGTFNNGLTVLTGNTFTNASSSLFTAKNLGDLDYSGSGNSGSIGSAATTVDVATTFNIPQTTAGQTFTLPSPAGGVAGRLIYINNTGSTSFNVGSVTLNAGAGIVYMWNGSAWVALTSGSSVAGVTTIGSLDTVGFSSSADGATISGNILYLQSATASVPGLVNTGSQTFAGNKTFSNAVTVSGLTTLNGGLTAVGTVQLNASGTGSTTIGSSSSNTSITLQDNSASSLVLNTSGTSIIGTLGVSGLATFNGGLTVATGQNFTVNGDAFTDLTGSGLLDSSGALTVDDSSSTGFFRNGGNNFGGNATVGTTGAGQTLGFLTAGATRAILDATGNLTFQQASTVGVLQASGSTTGSTLTVAAGQGGSGGAAGGVLALVGGAGAGTNQNGGNVTIDGGALTGSGTKGNIILQNGGGNVGIGTSGTPAALLSVGGTTGNFQVTTAGNASIASPANGNAGITITNTNGGASANSSVILSNGTTSGSIGVTGTGYSAVPIFQNSIFLFSGSADKAVIDTGSAQPIVFGVNNTEVARFDTAGALNLGLTGTSTGSIILKGSTAASGAITLTLATNNPGTHTINVPDAAGTICLQSATACGFALSSTGAQAFVQSGNSFSAAGDLGTNDNFALNFRTNGTTKLTVTTAGDLQFANGSGTQATRNLNIAQETGSTIGDNLTLSAGQGGSGGAAGGVLALQGGAGAGTNQNGGNITIDGGAKTGTGTKGNVILQGAGGNVGIGTSSTPSQLLSVGGTTGTLTVDTSGNLVTTGKGSFGTIGTPAASFIVDAGNNTNAGALIGIHNNSNGANALSGFGAYNDNAGATTHYGLFGVAGTGYTGIPLLQNYTFVDAGASTNGIVLNTQNTTPILFAVNNTEVARFDTAGALNLGLTGTSTGSIILKGSTAASGAITLTLATNNPGTHTINVPDAAGTICLQSATACGFALSSTGAQAFVQGGNSFGAQAELGTNDGNALAFRTNNADRAILDTSGNLTFQQASTVGVLQASGTTTGSTLTVAAGQGGSGGAAGGVLALVGGASGGTNQNGGNITIDGGALNGTGTKGNVILQGTGGNVGIGTSGTPSQLFSVGGSTGNLTVDTSGNLNTSGTLTVTNTAAISKTTTATSGANVLTSSTLTVSPASSPSPSTFYVGLNSVATSSSNNVNGTNTQLRGVQGSSTYSGTGTANALIGVIGGYLNSSTGTVTLAAGLVADVPSAGSGTITNGYGVYLNPQKQTGITNAYGVYQVGSSDLNNFAGKTAFGYTTAPTSLSNPLNVGTTGQFSVSSTGVVTYANAASSGATLVCSNSSQLTNCTNSYETTTGTDFIRNQATVQTSASYFIQPGSGVVGGVIKANGADTLDIQNSGGSVVAKFDASGNLTAVGGTFSAQVADTLTLTASGSGILSTLTAQPASAPGSTSGYSGVAGTTTATGSNINGNVVARGVYGSAVNSSSNTLGTAQGVFGQIFSGGNITNAVGVSGDIVNNGSGTFASAIALQALTPAFFSTGAITNDYGLYIQSQKVTGVTNAYGVYQVGTNDLNFFAGNTAIGYTTPPTSLSNPLSVGTTGQFTVTSGGVTTVVLGTAANNTPVCSNSGTLSSCNNTFAVNPGSGNYLVQVPTSNTAGAAEANVIAPTAASIVGLTVKGTTNATSAHVLDVYNSAASPTLQAYFDATGSLNVSQVIQPTSNNAIDLGLSGTAFRTGYFGTSVITPAIDAASGTLAVGSSGASTVTIGKSGGTVKVSNLTTNGVVYTSGGDGTLNSEAQLAISRGGTNSTATPTQGGVAYGTGSAYAFTSAGTSGQLLKSNGTGAPTFVSNTASNTCTDCITQVPTSNTAGTSGANVIQPTAGGIVSLVLRETTNASTANILDIRSSGGSTLLDYIDATGQLNVGQHILAMNSTTNIGASSGTTFQSGYFNTSLNVGTTSLTSTALTFAAAGSVTSANGQNLSLDTGTGTTNVNVGNTHATHVNVGNASGDINLDASTNVAANMNFTLQSGTGYIQQNYTGTTTDATQINANSVTTANALNVSATSLTTGSGLKVTTSNNSATSGTWSGSIFTITNAQATTANTSAGLDVQYKQQTGVAGNTESVARFDVAQNNNASTDTVVNSILDLADNDTATGSLTTVQNALNISSTNVDTDIALNGTPTSYLINASTVGFSVDKNGKIVTGNTVQGATINAQTNGFQIAGAATSGNYLRGNGAFFVSSALQASDLSGTIFNVSDGTTSSTVTQNQTVAIAAGTNISTSNSSRTITVSVINNPTFSGLVTAHANGTGLKLDGTVTAAGTVSLLQIGGSAIAGGSGNGTLIGANQSGSADFINLQTSGTPELVVDSSGNGTFNGSVTSNSGILTSGVNNSVAGHLQLANSGSGATAALGILQVQPITTGSGDVTYNLPGLTGGATVDICVSTGNCSTAGGGVTTLGGTQNFVTKFTGTQTVGNSLTYDNGSGVTVSTLTSGVPVTGLFNVGNTNQFQIASNGDITNSGKYNTNTFDGSSLWFGSAATASIRSASGQILNINDATGGNVNIGASSGSATQVTIQDGASSKLVQNTTGTAITGTLSTTGAATLGNNGTASGGIPELKVDMAPQASATSALVLVGHTAISGGSANGTYIGINQASCSSTCADLLNLQMANTPEFVVTGKGDVTINGGLVVNNANSAGNAVSVSGNISATNHVNASNGYFVGGGAGTAGQYLRSDGTNGFIAATFGGSSGADGAGIFLRNVPSQTSDNTVAPTANNTVALTVRATSGTGSPDILDIQNAGGSTTLDFFDSLGSFHAGASIVPTTTVGNNAIDLGTTALNLRSGYFGTTVFVPQVKPLDVSTVSATATALSLSGANETASSGTNVGGAVTISGGNANSGGTGTGGAVSIDSGAGTVAANNGAISLGTSNSNGITIGHNGSTFSTTNINGNVVLQSTPGTGTFTQNYSNSTAGTSATASTFAVTAGFSSGTNTLNGIGINLAGANNASGSNTVTAINLGNITSAPFTNNTFNAFTVGTGYTNGITFTTVTTNLIHATNFNVNNAGNITFATPGTADTSTYLCKNGSGIIDTCITTGASGVAYVQGGNNFGTSQDAILGTNSGAGSTPNLSIVTNGVSRLKIDTSGNFTFQATSTLTTQSGSNLNIDTGGANQVTVGNSNATTIYVGHNNVGHTIGIGDGGTSTAQLVTVGSTFTGSTLAIQAAGNIAANATGIQFSTGGARSISVATSAGAGSQLSITGQQGASAQAGGDLLLQAGAGGAGGTSGKVIVKAQDTTQTAAFQIQSTTTNLLTADTSSNMRISIGSPTINATTTGNGDLAVKGYLQVNGQLYIGSGSTNTVTTNGSNQLRFAGSSRNAVTITLVPEYPGAVMTGDGGNNVGTMTSDFCSNISGGLSQNASGNCATGEAHNYYSWTTNQSAQEDYDIWTRWQVPSNIASSDTTPTISFYGWRSSVTSDDVVLNVYNAAGVLCGTASSVGGAATTWVSKAYTMTGTTNCSFSPGDIINFDVHLTVPGSNSDMVRVGEIQFNYNAIY